VSLGRLEATSTVVVAHSGVAIDNQRHHSSKLRTDLCVGSDTALNSIVSDVDKIKNSAVASRRCFIVEVMGRDAGTSP
jgi:6-phosphofructokinase